MERPTTRQISCFLEICRDFHFTRAAARLGLAQPPLSRHVQELERIVGARLFDRSGKSVRLTAAGEVFLKSVYQVPSILERAVVAARRAAEGEGELLRIGFVGALLEENLLRVFERFRRNFPETQLALEDQAPKLLLNRVATGELDGAFLGVKPAVLPSDVGCLSWREEPLHVCLPTSHPLAHRKTLKLEDVKFLPLVTLSAEFAPAYCDVVETLYRKAGIQAPTTQASNAVAAVLSLVVAGCGVAFLPESAIRTGGAGMVAHPVLSPMTKLQEVFVFRIRENEPVSRMRALLQAYRNDGDKSIR